MGERANGDPKQIKRDHAFSGFAIFAFIAVLFCSALFATGRWRWIIPVIGVLWFTNLANSPLWGPLKFRFERDNRTLFKRDFKVKKAKKTDDEPWRSLLRRRLKQLLIEIRKSQDTHLLK